MTRKARVGTATLLALGICGQEARSQSSTDFGVRLGLTASTIRFEDPATDGQTGVLGGLHAGVLVLHDVGRRLSVEAGLQVAREGFGSGGAHTGDLHQDRIAVPLLLQVRTTHRFSLHATAGLTGKLTLRCRQVDVHGVGDVPCGDPVMGASWRRIDLAGVGGLGVSVPWASRTLATDARIVWGLRNLDGGLFIPGSARSLSVEISFTIFSPWKHADAGGDL
ncbi:MAG: outer membrane beta-barrel protein [Gemmatimonadota bacterium]|jgi:hypothetical protein